MLKKEIIYREILSKAIEERVFSFTQLWLSKKFRFSLSTVNNALKPLESIGAIEKRKRSFAIIDTKKALLYWASERNLEKDICYATRTDLPVVRAEASMPASVIFTAYSGYRMAFNDVPADYSEVYVYAGKKTIEEIKERFPKKKGPPNIFVLTADNFLLKRKKFIAPLPQIFVDLWNLKEWYARDFVNAFMDKVRV
ncbi:MAG: hypothetical protein QXL47_04725 [Candidatus Anstonellales archaeon]